MGSLIGKEIQQTRSWIDPKAKPPEFNYKYIYPITLLEAVLDSMGENPRNLEEILQEIKKELRSKQPIISQRSPNYLMTYGGVAGAVGAIEMSKAIPWDNRKTSHDKVPTEKAVSDLLMKVGLLDNAGNINDEAFVLRWFDILGRPEIYHELGLNTDGFIVQKAVSEAIYKLTDRIDLFSSDTDSTLLIIKNMLDNHIANKSNPHAVSVSSIGAVALEAFNFHAFNKYNPHEVNKEQIGLGNVDNTSDLDKPISNATQDAIDLIHTVISEETGVTALNFVKEISFDENSGIISFKFRSNSIQEIELKTHEMVHDIVYDIIGKRLNLSSVNGDIRTVDLSDLYIRYTGGIGTHITTSIEGDQITGQQIIRAKINDGGVFKEHLADLAVTTRAIDDRAVTGVKLSLEAVATENIEPMAVATSKIANRAVTGNKIFSSLTNNRVLGVVTACTDPYWLKINGDMIDINTIHGSSLLNNSVTHSKLDESSVITSKIADGSVTGEKISNYTIKGINIGSATIQGTNLVDDITLIGTPSISQRPSADSYNDKIPDTRWVKDAIDSFEFSGINLGDRTVNGRILFSSASPNRALVVKGSNLDAVWDKINNEMLETNSVSTSNIQPNAIVASKIANGSIQSNHISNNAVIQDHIENGAITLMKLEKSVEANKIVAVTAPFSHPVYTSVTGSMISNSTITAKQIQDESITLRKLETSEQDQMLLGVVTRNSEPRWMQATNKMLGDKSVDGRVLFTSTVPNRVLAVSDVYKDASWLQVNGSMIQHAAIKSEHIIEEAIKEEHLQDDIIDTKHLKANAVDPFKHMEARSIGPRELFTSPLPNRVLAVTTMPYSSPDWLQVTTGMIEDLAITREKIFQSHHTEYPYRVLGVTNPEVPPEYLMISNEFIVNDTITSEKLVRDLTLYGAPTIEDSPDPSDYSWKVTPTHWVQDHIKIINDFFNEEIRIIRKVADDDRAHVASLSWLETVDFTPDTTEVMTFTYRDGTQSFYHLPIKESLRSIYFDGLTSELVLHRYDGSELQVSLLPLKESFGSDVEVYQGNGIDSMSGFLGYTTTGGRVIISVPFKSVKITSPVITLGGAFKLRTPDNTVINLSSPTIISVTSSAAVIEFTMNEAYPSNSPCMLLYGEGSSITVQP